MRLSQSSARSPSTALITILAAAPEKYPFVFNAQIQTAENLAIVYNNRCYACLKSGEFKKALDDCNTSPRYGRLPDALHKQQELTKRLDGDST
jgi:hypothetical protein